MGHLPFHAPPSHLVTPTHNLPPLPSPPPSHSFQERTPKRGEPECLLQLTGQDLIGLPLTAPNATQQIYVLPLLTILTNKGTGIVTSVPSDSPDDYIALQVRLGSWFGGKGSLEGIGHDHNKISHV